MTPPRTSPMLQRLRRESGQTTLTLERAGRAARRVLDGDRRHAMLAALEGDSAATIGARLDIGPTYTHTLLRSARAAVAASLAGTRGRDSRPLRSRRTPGDKLRVALNDLSLDDHTLADLARGLGTREGNTLARHLHESIQKIAADTGRPSSAVTGDVQMGIVQLTAARSPRDARTTPDPPATSLMALEMWWPGRVSSLQMARRYAREQRLEHVQVVRTPRGAPYVTLVTREARVLSTGEVSPPRESRHIPLSQWAQLRGITSAAAVDLMVRGELPSAIDSGTRAVVDRDEPLPEAFGHRRPTAVIQARLDAHFPQTSDAQLRDVIDTAPDLTERERDVLRRRLLPPYARLQHVGDDLGISHERVRQIESGALRRVIAHHRTTRGAAPPPQTHPAVDPAAPPEHASTTPVTASTALQTVDAARLATLLTSLRERAGHDVARAAALLGVTPAQLGAWERGHTAPSLTELALAAEFYAEPLWRILHTVIVDVTP